MSAKQSRSAHYDDRVWQDSVCSRRVVVLSKRKVDARERRSMCWVSWVCVGVWVFVIRVGFQPSIINISQWGEGTGYSNAW